MLRRALIAVVLASVAMFTAVSPSLVSAATGDVLWHTSYSGVARAVVTAVAVSGGHAYVTEIQGEPLLGGPDWGVTVGDYAYVRALDADGTALWSTRFKAVGGKVSAWTVAASADAIYVGGTTTGTLNDQPRPSSGRQFGFAARLDPLTGHVIWLQQSTEASLLLGRSVTGIFATSSAVLLNGFLTGGRQLVDRLDPSDGTTMWRRETMILQPSASENYDAWQGLGAADDTGIAVEGISLSGNSQIRRYNNAGNLVAVEPGIFEVGALALATGGGYFQAIEDPQALVRLNGAGAVQWSISLPCLPVAIATYGEDVFVLGDCFTTTGNSFPYRLFAYRGDGSHLLTMASTNLFGIALAIDGTGAFVGGISGTNPSGDSFGGFVERRVIDSRPPVSVFTANRIPPYIVMPGDEVIVQPSWTARDDFSGIGRIDLQQSTDGKNWSDVTVSDPNATSALVDEKPGQEFRYRVRAVDAAGNTGAWSQSSGYLATLDQESSSAITFKGAWLTANVAGASGGSVMEASKAGASATISFTGDAVGFVTTTGPNRGKFAAYIDGSKVGVFDLYAAKSSQRWVGFAKSFSKNGQHTLQIVVQGTPGRPQVDLDAIEVLALAN